MKVLTNLRYRAWRTHAAPIAAITVPRTRYRAQNRLVGPARITISTVIQPIRVTPTATGAKGGDRSVASGDRGRDKWDHAHKDEQQDPWYQEGLEWCPGQHREGHPDQVAIGRRDNHASAEQRTEANKDLESYSQARDPGEMVRRRDCATTTWSPGLFQVHLAEHLDSCGNLDISFHLANPRVN
jgi:hypothetical protein